MSNATTHLDTEGIWNTMNATPSMIFIKKLKCNLTVGEFVKVASSVVCSPCCAGLIAVICDENNLGIVLLPLLTLDFDQRNNIGLINNGMILGFPEAHALKYLRVVKPEVIKEIAFALHPGDAMSNARHLNQRMKCVNVLCFRETVDGNFEHASLDPFADHCVGHSKVRGSSCSKVTCHSMMRACQMKMKALSRNSKSMGQ